jgi:membrane fusion protein (multidrug efflux system)
MKISLSFFKKHTAVSIISAIVVLLIAAIAARTTKKTTVVSDSETSKPVAQLINTKDYSQGNVQVSANGTVESLEQADLRSQATGKVTSVNVTIGQKVIKGQVLATLEQSNQLAALTSAKGALAQAQANYNRVLSGARILLLLKQL